MLRVNKNIRQSAFDMYGLNVISKNRIDSLSYDVRKTYIAGINLTSSETKDIHNRSCSINGSYVRVFNGAPIIINMYIHTTERRNRYLLLKRKEIVYLDVAIRSGLVLIPLCVFKYNNLFKLKLLLCKSIKKSNRRQLEKRLNMIYNTEIRNECNRRNNYE